MATMLEKQINKAMKDVEKYQKSIARHTALLEKKRAKAIKLDCNWTLAEWCEHRDAKTYTDEQYWAFSDVYDEEREIEDATHRLGTAEKILAKLTGKAEAKAAQDAEDARLADMEAKWWDTINAKTWEEQEAEYEKWLAAFKAECLRDGIVIEEVSSNVVYGTTASGKHFYMEGNNGITMRSLHCYMLRIDGNTIFTSGEFSTAYTYLKYKH